MVVQLNTYLLVTCGDSTRCLLYGRTYSVTTGDCLRLKLDESFTGVGTTSEGLMGRSTAWGGNSHRGLPVAWQRHPLGS